MVMEVMLKAKKKDFAAIVRRIDELLRLQESQREKLITLRDMFTVMQKVQELRPDLPRDFELQSFNYKPPTSSMYQRSWPKWARLRLPWFSSLTNNCACSYRGNRVITCVRIRETGEEIEFREPIFLDGAPWGTLKSYWQKRRIGSAELPKDILELFERTLQREEF